MVPGALGLMPFGERKIARVGLAAVHKAARHLPAVLDVQLAREIAQLHLEERQIFRRHRIGVDPAPDGMSVPAPFLFMKDDHAGMACKAGPLFNPGDGAFEGFDVNAFLRWRIERYGKEELLAARASAHRMGFLKGAYDIVRQETSDLVQFDMIVVVRPGQVKAELFAAATL